MPALRHAPAGELHVARVEGRLEFKERHRLLEVKHGCHQPKTLSDAQPISCYTVAGEPIYQMYKLSKVHPPDREVLKDISLSFLPGAKIGVLGYNGSGKSSLLAIMAGRDSEFRGDATLAPGISVGLLEQEPHLDESKDVRANVLEGVGHLAALLERFNELAANYSDETASEFAQVQDPDRRRRRLEPRRHDRARDGRAALPAGGRRDRRPSREASADASRSAGCCSPSPICSCSTSRPTISTRSRSSGSSTTSPNTKAPWSL